MTCTAKAKKKRHAGMRGGTWRGPSASPRVGCSWNGNNVNQWPGVAGVQGQTNYLALSKYGGAVGGVRLPVSTSNTMTGGKRTRRYGKGKGRHKRVTRRRRGRKGKSHKRRRTRSRSGGSCCGNGQYMTGGSGLVRGRLFPAQLVNAYRSVIHAPSKFINEWGGLKQPANLTATPTFQPALNNQKMPRMAVGSRISQGDMSTSMPM